MATKDAHDPAMPDSMPIPFVDALGRSINVGDWVTYIPTGDHEEFYYGVVEAFEVKYHGHCWLWQGEESVRANEFVTVMRILKTNRDRTPKMERKFNKTLVEFVETGKQERTGWLKHRANNVIVLS